MANLPLNEQAGVLVKTTCVDFPGHVACSFFLRGCNLRCPYCYNKILVDSVTKLYSEEQTSLSTIEELFIHLEKRQGIIGALVISGGEPLLNPYTPIIIEKAKSLGYKIKIDTNGTLPNELEALLHSPFAPDFIAMDIKTTPERYATELCNKNSKYYGNTTHFIDSIKKSIDLISSLPSDRREFRTVLVPSLISKSDIKNIAEILPKDANWQFAQFQNKNCLDSTYNQITPYTDNEIESLVEYSKSMVKGATLR